MSKGFKRTDKVVIF